MTNPLSPREAVAAILATPLDSRAFFAGMTAAEFFAIHPQVIAPPEEGDPRVTVIEQTKPTPEPRRGATALPGMDVAKKGKGKKARA